MNYPNVITIVIVILLLVSLFISFRKEEKSKNDIIDKLKNDSMLKETSLKLIIPLKIQACERLLLYIERIQFPVLVKRIFHPGISRNDFQFSIIQNVQDEFEHNLAQRLYVSRRSTSKCECCLQR